MNLDMNSNEISGTLQNSAHLTRCSDKSSLDHMEIELNMLDQTNDGLIGSLLAQDRKTTKANNETRIRQLYKKKAELTADLTSKANFYVNREPNKLNRKRSIDETEEDESNFVDKTNKLLEQLDRCELEFKTILP